MSEVVVSDPRADGRAPERYERRIAALLVLLAVALRIVLAFRLHVDSDEPQHLHVVWAWTQGLLPYRDVFDNHMPLFGLLCAPLLRLVGERPDALVIMRLAMLPCFGVVLWSLRRLGRVLFSPRVARWSPFAALVGGAFLCSIEFRPDDLWAACWLAGLAVAVGGRPTPRRGFVAGLLVGTALAVSLKTVLMLLALAGATAGTLLLCRDLRHSRTPLAPALGAAVLGAAVMPLAVTTPFALAGALRPYVYETIGHNLLPGLGDWGHTPGEIFAFPLAVAAAALVAARVRRTATDPRLAVCRTFVFLAMSLYLAALATLWPLRTRQDFLPLLPLAALWLLAVLDAAGERLARRLPRMSRAAVPAAATAVALGLAVAHGQPWRDAVAPERRLVEDVLALAAPGDRVLDSKGDAIFRPRAIDYVLEGVTKARLARGLLPDDIAARVVAAHTTVSLVNLRDLLPGTREFVRSHYVPVGDLRVAGSYLGAGPHDSGTTFDVAVPSVYAIVAERAPVSGLLDGTPYDGPRFLGAGPHEFVPTDAQARHAVVWDRAIELGFAPVWGHRKLA